MRGERTHVRSPAAVRTELEDLDLSAAAIASTAINAYSFGAIPAVSRASVSHAE
jgi:hypothetical protein